MFYQAVFKRTAPAYALSCCDYSVNKNTSIIATYFRWIHASCMLALASRKNTNIILSYRRAYSFIHLDQKGNTDMDIFILFISM